MNLEIRDDGILDGTEFWPKKLLKELGINQPYIIDQTEHHLIVNGVMLRGSKRQETKDHSHAMGWVVLTIAALVIGGLLL